MMILSGKLQTFKLLIKNITDKGFFHLMSATFLVQVFAFGSQFFVAWILSPEQLGQIKIMQTYLSLGVLVAVLGFDTSTLKLCSENRSKEEIIYIYRAALKYVTYSVSFVLPMLYMISLFGLISKDVVINKLFPFFCIALIPFAFNNVMSVYLQARKEMKSYSKIQIGTKFSTLSIIVILTYLFNIYGFIAGLVMSYIITHFVLKNKINRLNSNTIIKPIEKIFKTHWNYAQYSFLANFVGTVGQHTDVLLMNYFISDRVLLGQYSFAITATLFTRIFTSTVQQITLPYLSEKSANKSQLMISHKKYYRLNIVSSFGIMILMLTTIPLLIKYTFSGKYDESIQFFIILMIAWFFKSLFNFKGYTIFGIGEIKMNFYTVVFMTSMGFVVSYLFMLEWGILGLAYGQLIVNILSFIIVSVIFKYVMNKYEKNH